MKKLRLISVLFLFIGLAYILCCFFLPLTTSCEETSGPEEFIDTSQKGLQVPSYIINVVLIGLMVLRTYNKNKSYVTPIIITIVGVVMVFFINSMRQAGFGKPCGFSPTIYMKLLYIADVLVIISCFARVYINRKSGKNVS